MTGRALPKEVPFLSPCRLMAGHEVFNLRAKVQFLAGALIALARETLDTPDGLQNHRLKRFDSAASCFFIAD